MIHSYVILHAKIAYTKNWNKTSTSMDKGGANGQRQKAGKKRYGTMREPRTLGQGLFRTTI